VRPEIDIQRDAAVYCNDGPLGMVRQVVVDAGQGSITDLIVEREDGERLVVPAAVIAHTDGRTVTLRVPQADLLRSQAATLPYRPEDYAPLRAQQAGAAPDTAEQESLGEAALPADPSPDPVTDPAMLRPFAGGVLRIPLRGERLVVERTAVVAAEIVIRKTKRHETVQLRGTVRKERIDLVDKRARAGE